MPDSEAKDRFEIRGDEVVKKEIKEFGGSAHITISKKHRGKRAKVVIIENDEEDV